MADLRIGKLRVEQVKATSSAYTDLGEQLRAMPDAWEYVVHPSDGQTLFTLPREYTMGYASLIVYVNGQKVQGPENDQDLLDGNWSYQEVDPKTIEFNTRLNLTMDDTLVFRQEGAGAATSFVAEVEHIIREKPNGPLDGVNKQFELKKYPKPDTECIYLNGILLDPTEGDYTISGKVFTLSSAPKSTDRLQVNYLRARNAVITYETTT